MPNFQNTTSAHIGSGTQLNYVVYKPAKYLFRFSLNFYFILYRDVLLGKVDPFR